MHRSKLIVFGLLAALTAPAHAGPFEDGLAAADRGDHAGAVDIWTPYAEQGDIRTQYNLGILHYRGQGVAEDHKEAIRWFRLAAGQGHGRAQFNLAFMYDRGQGVAEDNTQAMKWYQKAAEQGDARAKGFLSFMYQTGDGVAVDYVLAYMWLDLAAMDEGGGAAIRLRDAVGADHLTNEQIARARHKAEEWRAKHGR